MTIHDIVWSKVFVKCESDPSKDRVLYDVNLQFRSDISCLEIYSIETHIHLTYAKASIIDLTSRSAGFNACWWSADFTSSDYDTLIPVKVTCEF